MVAPEVLVLCKDDKIKVKRYNCNSKIKNFKKLTNKQLNYLLFIPDTNGGTVKTLREIYKRKKTQKKKQKKKQKRTTKKKK